jgi:hypothetical protein
LPAKVPVNLAEILFAEELRQPLQPKNRRFRPGVFRHDVLTVKIKNVSNRNLIRRPERAGNRISVPLVDVVG